MRAANARRVVVTEFGPDPYFRGRIGGAIAQIWARVQGRYTTPTLGASFDPGNRLTGYAANPQSFAAMTNRGGTTSYAHDGGYPDITSGIVEGPMGDPARRIFAQRMRRQASL